MTTDTKKPKRERFVTPPGIAKYPRLTAPDFKYKKEHGEYSVKLRLTANEAAPIIAKIDEATIKAYAVECAKQEKTKLKKSIYKPYAPELDDQEKPTGNMILTFKLTGGFKSKKTGEIVKLKPAIYDRFGKIVTEEMWGGSTIQVSYTLKSYYTEGIGHGLSLNIEAVRVVNLVTRGAGTAESYGFTVEDDPSGGDEEEADETPVQGAAGGTTKQDF